MLTNINPLLTSLALVAVVAIGLGLSSPAAAQAPIFEDGFANLDATTDASDLDLVQQCARIPLEPDVRIDRSGEALFPTVIGLANGDLLCAFHEPTHGVNPEHGRDMVCYSTDGGQTWSDEILAIDVPGVDDRDPILCQTPDGRVWMGAAGGHAIYSDDNGRTWSEPIKGGTYPVGLMDNGEFIWTRGGRGTGVLQGIEEGSLKFEDFVQPNLRRNSSDEWYMAITAVPGRLVTMMREQNMGEYYYTGISTDYGRTFTPARPSSIWHSPNQSRPLLMTMDDGTVVCTYGERQNNRVMAIASFDHGETWDTHHKLVICDNYDLMHGDFSYPQACQVDDSRLLAVWYASNKVYGNFLDARSFKDVYGGVRLADSASPMGENCVAYWSFDEADGPIANDPARYNYGKISGAQRVPGKVGRALRFDGEDDYVMVIDCDILRVPRYYTLEAWINTDDASREQTIIDKGGPYYLGLHEGKLIFHTGTITFAGEQVLDSNQWYHIAVVVWPQREYSRVSFYINGQRDGEVHSISHNTHVDYLDALLRSDMRLDVGPQYREYYQPNDQRVDALAIGISKDWGSYPFMGLIDEVAIHSGPLADYMNYSLSQTEEQIRQRMQRTYQDSGRVVSARITKPADAKWGIFQAATTQPHGTGIKFSVTDADGQVLLDSIQPGADLSALTAEAIHLIAELTTQEPSQTPILHDWSVR